MPERCRTRINGMECALERGHAEPECDLRPIPAPTPPSGESAPPSLEERLRRIRDHAGNWDDDVCLLGNLTALEIGDACEQAARLSAEVARLTALLEDHGPDGRNVTNAQHQAMRERARRYRDALEEALYRLGRSRVWGGTDWTYHALSPAQYRPVLESIDRALTEGADR